jgi:hypothetical protein
VARSSATSLLFLLPYVWLVLAVLACAAQKAPKGMVDTGSTAAPLPVYSMWWDLVQACAQRSERMSNVTWRTTISALRDGQADLVRWVPSAARIDVPSAFIGDGALVRHAMLHAVLHTPASEHPRDAFVRRCGGVVQCEGTCATEGHPASDSGALDEPLSTIEVFVRIIPEAPSRDVFGGFAAVLVEARNPLPRRVIVRPSASAEKWLSPLFTLELGGPSVHVMNNARPAMPDFTIFEAGERKLQVFDLRIGLPPTQGGLPIGTVELKGAYQTKWASAQAPITIRP